MKFNLKYPTLVYASEGDNANFAYFSELGFEVIDGSFLYLNKGVRVLVVPNMHEKNAKELVFQKIVKKHKNETIHVVVYGKEKGDFKKIIKGLLQGKSKKKKKIGIDAQNLNANLYMFIKKSCTPVDVSEELLKIRSFKKKDELKKLKKAVKLTKQVINSVNFKGKTEVQVASDLLLETAKLGLKPAFRPIVATNPNSKFPHHKSQKRKIKDFVLIDYGVKFEDYCGDITRCFSLNKGPWSKDYEIVKGMCLEIIDEVKNFKYAGEIAEFEAKLHKKYKLPKRVHTGHGIGLEVHEYPRLSKRFKDPIKNTVFTVEPGFYLNKWGVRHEECVYFDGKKAKIL